MQCNVQGLRLKYMLVRTTTPVDSSALSLNSSVSHPSLQHSSCTLCGNVYSSLTCSWNSAHMVCLLCNRKCLASLLPSRWAAAPVKTYMIINELHISSKIFSTLFCSFLSRKLYSYSRQHTFPRRSIWFLMEIVAHFPCVWQTHPDSWNVVISHLIRLIFSKVKAWQGFFFAESHFFHLIL